MDPYRAGRISEALREELSEMIGYELTDPRVDGVEVTGVHVVPDRSVAMIRLKIGGTGERKREVIEALQGAKRFLRREVGLRLQLRRVPDLQFEEEQDPEVISRMERLLKRVHKQQRKAAGAPQENPD